MTTLRHGRGHGPRLPRLLRAGPGLIDFRFDLETPTQQVAVLFFTSNMLLKRHSDFLALDLLTGVGIMGDLGLLLVNPSEVETIVA